MSDWEKEKACQNDKLKENKWNIFCVNLVRKIKYIEHPGSCVHSYKKSSGVRPQ